MKSIVTNARENLSDEQLKQVTGGARVNSRPEAARDHLIDYGHFDLHGATATDVHPFAPSKQSLESGPGRLIETIEFSRPVTSSYIVDPHGHPMSFTEIDVLGEGIPTDADSFEVRYLNPATGQEFDTDLYGLGLAPQIIAEAKAQGDQVSINVFSVGLHAFAVAASPGLPESDGRSDSGGRETTTWPMPDSGR